MLRLIKIYRVACRRLYAAGDRYVFSEVGERFVNRFAAGLIAFIVCYICWQVFIR
jgi:hypothetical protein